MGIPVSQNTPTIRIYGWWQRPYGEAFDYCTPEQAKGLIERKLARRRMSGFAIQLRQPSARSRLSAKIFMRIVTHGKSCQMGPRMTEDAAFGEPHLSELAKEAALAYLLVFRAPDNQAGSYCPLVLR
jgi:hypothetical protein